MSLKNKLGRSVILFAAVFLCLAISLGIIVIIDDFYNGTFADWFYHRYVYEYTFVEASKSLVIERISWIQLKHDLILAFLIFIFFSAILFIILFRYAVHQSIQRYQKKLTAYLKRRLDENSEISHEFKEIDTIFLNMKQQLLKREELLKQETQRKNDMIAGLAHDLKTPLASVIGYLSFLDESDGLTAKKRRKYTRIAFEKALRLDELIDQFFDLTRFNLSFLTLNRSHFSLSLFFQQLADEFVPLLENRKLQINCPKDLYIDADSDKLARVFNNLLRNAIAYSSDESTITITAILLPPLTMTVTNTGSTIAESELEHIFERFFRIDLSRSPLTGKSGLGLAIAREIIEAHGGKIEAQSADNQTSFIIQMN